MTLPTLGWKLPALGILLLAVLFLTRHCGPTPDPSGPYREQLARMAHQHSLDSAERASAYQQAVARVDSLEKVASFSFKTATDLRRKADSLARLPRYIPTAVVTPCDSALVLTMQERDTLRVAYDTLTASYGTLFHAFRGSVEQASAAYTGWMRAEGQLSQERATWEDEREAWRATVRRVKPCSLLGLVGCPTLTVGYGAVLSGGQVRAGPSVSVGLPIRF